MELDEFHVLQRQPGAQRHGAAVAGAGVCGGAGLIHSSTPARGDDRHVGAEAVNRAILQAPGEQAAAAAILVHQQVNGEIFDEEARLVLQALLVERMQNRVAGAVGGGAGAISHVALCIFGRVPAKSALIDHAGLRSAERHARMLELDDRWDRLAAHVCDRILVPEPVGAPDRVEHVPTPIVLFHVAERGADSPLRGDRVAASRKNLGDAGSVQASGDHAECRPQPGAAGAQDDHVEGVVDDVVTVGHGGLLNGRGRA